MHKQEAHPNGKTQASKRGAHKPATEASRVVLFPVWPSGLGWARRATGNGAALGSATRGGLLLGPLTLLLLLLPLPLLLAPAAGERLSSLQLNQETNAYTGLTFAFDPRLAQLETNGSELAAAEIQFSRWLDIMQRSSALLYESLAGRAYLAEVRVLLPYRWLAKEWPLVQKPAGLTAWNRRLRYASADVLVGFEDPVHGTSPFALQHDECARQGLNIHMPISFLAQSQQAPDSSLAARLFVREFAAHRYGLFKESGFRNDPMYPPFSSLAGFPQQSRPSWRANRTSGPASLELAGESPTGGFNQSAREQLSGSVRGFDQNWNECSFETNAASGLPAQHALACAPYLARTSASSGDLAQGVSFNLMSADPFSHAELAARGRLLGQQQARPVEWRELSESARWHFCGDQFAQPAGRQVSGAELAKQPALAQQQQQQQQQVASSFAHNQLTSNKQNVMCNERSAMDVIRSSEDFKRTQFRFLQEMAPRLIMCVEYSAHLYQSRRLDHGILDSAIAKFLAYDLIAGTELALVLFGQRHSTKNQFKRLDSSIDSRLTLFNPPIDPFDEPAKLYSEQELLQMDIQSASSQLAKLVKGSCSFAKLMLEVESLLRVQKYDDVGCDVVVLTSGLFVEDEQKIEDILRSLSYKLENLEFNILVYPSTMLFDTKSRDGFVVLDSIESEAIVRNRVNKLLLIQRLTNAKIHLVKEHLDSNGDVKMSTLAQFYQIFDHISKGHSWDQTESFVMLSQQNIEPKWPPNSSPSNRSKLSFQFELDSSIQNELIVGFIDPKQHQLSRSGKRFSIKNLQLRSPSGNVVYVDRHPWCLGKQLGPSGQREWRSGADNSSLNHEADENAEARQSGAGGSAAESTLFPYRSQLSLAGFQLKVGQLNGTQTSGVWTLSATSDEPIQTSALAMARVNPDGDTITARCWIQTYSSWDQSELQQQLNPESAAQSAPLRAVKVFMQTRGAAQAGPVQEVLARMEVQDEMGNIVQNVNMLDDGLGVPDMTRGDGIHSQYVQRAHRPGFYRVTVEASGPMVGREHEQEQELPLGERLQPADEGPSRVEPPLGHDRVCCGSFVPSAGKRADTRHLSRQLYCGTFYVDSSNRLAQQRPPRVNNLTVVNVDQENRRVTIRWFEPMVDISVQGLFGSAGATGKLQPLVADNYLAAQSETVEQQSAGEPMMAPRSNNKRSLHLAPRTETTGASQSRQASAGEEEEEEEVAAAESQRDVDMVFDTMSASQAQQMRANSIRGVIVAAQTKESGVQAAEQVALNSRYEIKLFSDRDAARRAFDSKQEVGFKFNEWSVEGNFPNASAYGGAKEVTLKIPYAREGIYYIAMKVYNNLGVGSQASNIIQFWLKNNLTLEEAESIYGQSSTVDAEGNVYDKNGELVQRSSGYPSLRATSSLDTLSLLVFISVVTFVLSVVCISLVTCLASSVRKSLSKGHSKAEDKKAVTAVSMHGASCGSSVGSSGCGGSQRSEPASSVSGSQGGHDVEINKLSLGEELNYNTVQQLQQHQLHQAQLIHQNHMISAGYHVMEEPSCNQHQYNNSKQQQQRLSDSNSSSSSNADKGNQWLQHTMVNGYAYATVNGLMLPEPAREDCGQGGNLNQNGLGNMSSVQSWPADILLSHYDKVKQARERNEAPPVMRVENIEHQGQFSEGLPTVDELGQQTDQSYLVRQQRNQVPSYFNQQLQRQLSSVLRSKQRQGNQQDECASINRSSPALEGVRDPHDAEGYCSQLEQVAPPQYVYCADGATQDNGLRGQPVPMADPSIYSQATNLQQVSSVADSMGAYYANQWPTGGASSQIYAQSAASSGSLSQADPYQASKSHQHQLGRPKTTSDDYAASNCLMHKTNSAISEV